MISSHVRLSHQEHFLDLHEPHRHRFDVVMKARCRVLPQLLRQQAVPWAAHCELHTLANIAPAMARCVPQGATDGRMAESSVAEFQFQISTHKSFRSQPARSVAGFTFHPAMAWQTYADPQLWAGAQPSQCLRQPCTRAIAAARASVQHLLNIAVTLAFQSVGNGHAFEEKTNLASRSGSVIRVSDGDVIFHLLATKASARFAKTLFCSPSLVNAHQHQIQATSLCDDRGPLGLGVVGSIVCFLLGGSHHFSSEFSCRNVRSNAVRVG